MESLRFQGIRWGEGRYACNAQSDLLLISNVSCMCHLRCCKVLVGRFPIKAHFLQRAVSKTSPEPFEGPIAKVFQPDGAKGHVDQPYCWYEKYNLPTLPLAVLAEAVENGDADDGCADIIGERHLSNVLLRDATTAHPPSELIRESKHMADR